MTTPGVKGLLKQTLLDAGSGQFIWAQGSNDLNGYNSVTSTQVPSDLTKGSGSDLHAMIFGNWQDLLIGYWGTIDIVVDNITLATNGQIKLVMNQFVDTLVRRPQSFSAAVDIIVA